MLNLNINCDILQEKNIVRFNGAALELMRYEGQEIQVNTYIYLEKDGKKYQFITYNHCDAQKNVSLDKKIICEEIQNYEFPEETRKNQIIYYLPPEGKEETALTKLTRRREQDDYDGAFPGDNVSGCEYFAWLNGEGDDNYMVLLSTKNLTMVFRPQFMDKFGIDMLAQRNHELFENVFTEGNVIKFDGALMGIVKISDIYAVETCIYIEKDGEKYVYRCLEKFDDCREEIIKNTRFYREISFCKTEEFNIPDESEYAMLDCYISYDDKPVMIKKTGRAQYGKYVPFEDKDVEARGCGYFNAVLENQVDKDSENMIYLTIEACRKTRYKKLKNML